MKAFNRYKNLLTLDPGNCNILFHCGACCLNIPGNEEQAITYYNDSLNVCSTLRNAHERLAAIHLKNGEKELARGYTKHACLNRDGRVIRPPGFLVKVIAAAR